MKCAKEYIICISVKILCCMIYIPEKLLLLRLCLIIISYTKTSLFISMMIETSYFLKYIENGRELYLTTLFIALKVKLTA
jgi:hypothetical protein